jgi:signal transduction histidine kinase/ActR/RegA family two-component response regulator
MSKFTLAYHFGKYLWLCLFLLLSFENSTAQYVFKEGFTLKRLSIHDQTKYIDVKNKNLTLEEVIKMPKKEFKNIPNENYDFGFTNSNIWLRFELKNETNDGFSLYFETARPITDYATLYILKEGKLVDKYVSGDAVPYEKRSFDLRKTIFKIRLNPNETKEFYLHVKSDGEMLSMPLLLRKSENLLAENDFEQFIFGFFYGILAIASILYLFFFFGMRDKTFFYYSMYVVFIGLLQFSIDGYFYKYIAPNAGWLSLHAVAVFACIANFFLGRYAQVFLKIKTYNKQINNLFYTLYFFVGLLFLSLFVFPNALEFAYPLANALGLVLLGLIIASQISIYNKTKQIDKFFAVGILFLISGFVVFILKNFSILPLNFWTENGSKLGTGMEVIFLSLSMANLIRNLKNEREQLQKLALQKAEEMNELKSYFLSNISHELRTPLNAILNTAKAIANETEDEQIKSNSQIIKYSTYSLLSSINDILDFSKIEKNEIKLEITEFDLAKTVEHIANNFAREAKDKGLDFSFQKGDELPEMVKGDAVRIGQILHNILSNALKFTHEGFVKFKLESVKDKDNMVNIRFTISDTGVGISKEKMDSIFDSFSQDSINNKRKFGGLGLGLYIVKHLLNLQNGKIKVDSTLGLGTVCTIELTLENVVTQKQVYNASSSTDYDLNGKSILVIEDNAMNQMVIKMITKKWLNTKVDFANNGLEGVQKLTDGDYDIILMDLQMPIMDGYEATIAIRNGDAGENKKSIPIIALTADVMESTKTRVIEIGMNKYLSKPVDKDTLFEVIKLSLN